MQGADDNRIDVLDKGFVRLVDHMGSDLSVVRAARNSYDAAWRAGEDTGGDAKLIKYLYKHQHSTPFEAVTMTFEIKAPIFVFRQWHRHRTQSYNEVSARYTVLRDEFYVPEVEQIGEQDKKNRQGRIIGVDMIRAQGQTIGVDTLRLARQRQIGTYEDFCRMAFDEYKSLLDDGWPRELARMVLPLSTYSKMFTTLNLWNLMRFLTLRSDEHAQYEIRVYADAMVQLAQRIAPVCMEAWLAGMERG